MKGYFSMIVIHLKVVRNRILGDLIVRPRVKFNSAKERPPVSVHPPPSALLKLSFRNQFDKSLTKLLIFRKTGYLIHIQTSHLSISFLLHITTNKCLFIQSFFAYLLSECHVVFMVSYKLNNIVLQK